MTTKPITAAEFIADTVIAAAKLVTWLENYAQDKPRVVIGLCGGTSPFVVPQSQSSPEQIGFFPALIQQLVALTPATRGKLCFRLVDERLYAEHNEVMLREKFVAPAIAQGMLNQTQVEFYPLHLASTETHGTAEYWQLFADTEKFDVVILGTGYPHQKDEAGKIISYDCHVAGCFAHHESTTSAAAQQPGFVFYDQSPKPPAGRVTATLPLLAKAKLAVLIVVGEGKHAVLRECMNSEVKLEDCPVKVVEQIAERIVLSDITL